MGEFGSGPEVSDVPKKGGETIVSAQTTIKPDTLSGQAISAIQGSEPSPASPATPMTLEEKALQPTASEVLSPKAISAIQGKPD